MKRVLGRVAMLVGLVVVLCVAYVAWIALDAGSPFVYRNVSRAMEPTLLVGERITAQRLRDDNGSLPLYRGEIVVMAYPPDPSKLFIKRIVAMAGDTIAMAHRVLSRNGRAVDEPYLHTATPGPDPVSPEFLWQRGYLADTAAAKVARYTPSRDTWGPLVVPRGQLFVLGDNRDESLDSRHWGFLPRSNVRARARRVYYSRDPATSGFRLRRFGRLLR